MVLQTDPFITAGEALRRAAHNDDFPWEIGPDGQFRPATFPMEGRLKMQAAPRAKPVAMASRADRPILTWLGVALFCGVCWALSIAALMALTACGAPA